FGRADGLEREAPPQGSSRGGALDLERDRWVPGPFDCGFRRSVDRRHAAAVLRPAALVRLDAVRTLLAVRDDREPARIDAEGGQVVGNRVGAALTQRKVVFAGTALIGVTLDGHCDG